MKDARNAFALIIVVILVIVLIFALATGKERDDDRNYGVAATDRFEGARDDEDVRIVVDKETGVNYVLYFTGFAQSGKVGMTALLDADGNPVITSVEVETE